jgi:hypothetical protein
MAIVALFCCEPVHHEAVMRELHFHYVLGVMSGMTLLMKGNVK